MKALVKIDGEGDNAFPYFDWAAYPDIIHVRRYVGKLVDVRIDIWTGKRSQRQNRFYWGVLIPAFMEAMDKYGDIVIDKDEAHEAIKLKWLSRLVIIKNQQLRIPKSTTNLSPEEFSRLVQKVELWCNNCGIYLPEQWEG